MHLVQLLLPLYDNEGVAIPQQEFRTIAGSLADQFGGITAHHRAPAMGLWKEDSGETARDEIVVYEVMTETLDPEWWGSYRRTLERVFRQDAIVIRTFPIALL
jgi:hypothetical protein